MQDIRFHDREREIEEIMGILSSRPDLVTFIYGPINSGKTELLMHVSKNLGEGYGVFYINLRHVYVGKVDDFLKVLFDVREESLKDLIGEIVERCVPDVITLGRIPIPKKIFKELFEEKKKENVFVYLENFFGDIAKRSKPVLIIDELQKIGDTEIDGPQIYELFNFFIGLTKVLRYLGFFVFGEGVQGGHASRKM